MDNWTLLSARFDVSEEAMMEVQGRLQRHGRVGNGGVEQVGLMHGEGKERKCARMQAKRAGLDEIKEKHNDRSVKGRDRCLNSDWSLNIYLCLPMLRGEMAV